MPKTEEGARGKQEGVPREGHPKPKGGQEVQVQMRTPTGWKTLIALIDSGANETSSPTYESPSWALSRGWTKQPRGSQPSTRPNYKCTGYTGHASERQTTVEPPESLIAGC
ncbi:MAG: hypothetical protein M1816_001173 [Peltula sp. TS41687]|nr:MAG: hypothetical protein M1816_001173 [Peltula sp. TS41687]